MQTVVLLQMTRATLRWPTPHPMPRDEAWQDRRQQKGRVESEPNDMKSQALQAPVSLTPYVTLEKSQNFSEPH